MIKLNNLNYLKDNRKALRNHATPTESRLWFFLKQKKLNGYKFRRQHSFGNYILDFYCPEIRLAIELDGQHHFTPSGKINDEIRDAFLNDHEIKVLRFENKEVFENVELVLAQILEGVLGK
jgi:very-short-patch-repair endonuclease